MNLSLTKSYIKPYKSNPQKPYTFSTYPRKNLSFSFVLYGKFDFDYRALVDKRTLSVELRNLYEFHKEAPNMLKKLNSGQKLSESDTRLAERAGLKITNGVPEGDNIGLLEGFANDRDSKKEYKRALKANEQKIEEIIKEKSLNSTSGPSNFQNTSEVTNEMEFTDFTEE